MKAIDSLVGTARVVALGESSHGTHEPLAFRNRLLKHLVEDLGFTAIAMETGFSESRGLYDFVLGATGEAISTAREGFTWGFGGFAENVELISWIAHYNADPSHHRKIHCYGIDLSGGVGGELTHARTALDAVERYLQRVAPDAARDALRVIDIAGDRFTTQGYRRLSNDERHALHAVIGGWASLFEQRRSEFIAASAQSEYEWAHRNAIVANHIEQALQAWPEDPPQGLSPDLYKVVAIRDAAMADNVQWVLEREGPGARVLVFAHNAHVMNAATRGGIWKVYREAPAAMGQHLRSALGESLVIVGVASAGTGPGLPAMSLPPGGLDETLEAVGVPRFVLDLRPSNAPVVNAWLDEPQVLAAGFVTEHLVAPRKAFDAFVFFNQLTPAHLAGAQP